MLQEIGLPKAGWTSSLLAAQAQVPQDQSHMLQEASLLQGPRLQVERRLDPSSLHQAASQVYEARKILRSQQTQVLQGSGLPLLGSMGTQGVSQTTSQVCPSQGRLQQSQEEVLQGSGLPIQLAVGRTTMRA